jgi:hypothetical protein
MCQSAGATQGGRIALRHGPIADVLAVVVGAQAIGLILATRSFISPQTILTLLDGGNQVPVGQIRKGVTAVQTADVLEENEMLTMRAMECFHVVPSFMRRLLRSSPTSKLILDFEVHGRPRGPVAHSSQDSRLRMACARLRKGTVQTANRFFANK